VLHKICREGQELKICSCVWRPNAVSGSSEYQPYWNRSDRTFTLAKHTTGTWWQWARSSCTTHQWPTSHLLAHILFVVHSVVLFITARPELNPAHRYADAGRNMPPLDGRHKSHTTNSRAGPIWAKQFVKKWPNRAASLDSKSAAQLLTEIPCLLVTRIYRSATGKVFQRLISVFLNLSRIAQAASHPCSNARVCVWIQAYDWLHVTCGWNTTYWRQWAKRTALRSTTCIPLHPLATDYKLQISKHLFRTPACNFTQQNPC